VTRISIPENINADGLLPFVSLIGQSVESDGVELDFSPLRRVTPAGLVALVATVIRWRNEKLPVRFVGLRDCAILEYLQRMDVLNVCGVEMDEEFIRREANGRFMPVRLVDHKVEEMGSDLAGCIAPGGEDYEHPMSDLYEIAWYVFTEIANNIRQHSGGLGFAAAQANRREGLVRFTLADNGMGILDSFRYAGLAWSKELDDCGAISKALEPKVSSKAGEQNQGVGLTLVSGLTRLLEGWLLIVSGTGVLRIAKGNTPNLSQLPHNGRYDGTLIALTIRQDMAADFPRLLHNAKINAGLLRTDHPSGNFQ